MPATFSAVPWTKHPDARVRSEAIRLQLTLPHERDLGVHRRRSTIADPRIVHLGLTAIRDECPPHLVERVIDLALASDLGEDSRLLAVNSLAPAASRRRARRAAAVVGSAVDRFWADMRLPAQDPGARRRRFARWR